MSVETAREKCEHGTAHRPLCEACYNAASALYRIRLTKDVVYNSDILLAGTEHDVHHESPWGPVVNTFSPLGHRYVVPRKNCEKI